jgi:hypothetical protein
LRERLSLQLWPAAGVLTLLVAGVLVTAGILAMGGKSEEQAGGATTRSATATAAPATSDAAKACARGASPASEEPTLFDDLAKGASRDDPHFEVSFGAEISDHSAGAHADLDLEMAVGAENVAPRAFYVTIPPEWGITPGCQIPVGLAIGKLRWDALLGRDGNPCNEPGPLLFDMLNATTDTTNTVEFKDADGNGRPDFAEDKDASGRADVLERYPSFLKRMFPGRLPIRRTVGLFKYVDPPILAQSLFFESLSGSKGTTLVIILQDLGDPEAVPGESGFTDYCTPVGFRISDSGATFQGLPLFTNPTAGRYQFILTAFGERDADGDGIENTLDTCPFDVNQGNPRVKGEGDADEDGLDAACDPNDFEPNPDQDGDGYLNRVDLCPLVPATDTTKQKDADGDGIGDECDTSGNGPNVPDGHVSFALQAGEVVIR